MSFTNFVDVPKAWPRRLLHIPSMTSLERESASTYGNITEPSYSVLSYTWGRYAVSNGPRLPVKGISWGIPAIDESHFSVADFSHVISVVGKFTDHLWLDVACIDQEDRNIKMDEIGKQVGIFNTAKYAFVWLSHLPREQIFTSLEYIEYCFTFLDINWQSQLEEDLPTTISRISSAVESVLIDPWFSSLWTLQEAVLRSDAMLLSKEASPIDYESRDNRYGEKRPLKDLIHGLWRLSHEMHDAQVTDERSRNLIRKTLHLLRQSGLSYRDGHNNPNIQYSAAGFRNATYELDRIYGIMAIYNIRVGETAGQRRDLTLDILEDEFALALNAKSPLLGQLFLHTQRPRPGKTWRITQECIVHERFRFPADAKSHSTISSTGGGNFILKGRICFLAELYDKEWKETLRFEFNLDAYVLGGVHGPPESMKESKQERMDRLDRLIPYCLQEWSSDRLSVLVLAEEDHEYFSHKHGLVLLHDEDDRESVQRIGICDWTEGLGRKNELVETQAITWTDFDGVFA